jgi:hypothetical protein
MSTHLSERSLWWRDPPRSRHETVKSLANAGTPRSKDL